MAGAYNTKKEVGYYRQGELDKIFLQDGKISCCVDDQNVCTNLNYMYIATTHGVEQYKETGEKISKREFSEEEFIECMYAGEELVYVLTVRQSDGDDVYRLYALNAEQISQTKEVEKKEKINLTGAFISYDGTFVSHHAVEFPEVTIYYCGAFEEKMTDDGEKYYIITGNGEEEFVPVMAEKTSGRGILKSAEDVIFRDFLAVSGDNIYSWDDGESDHVMNYLKVYSTDSTGKSKMIYESEKYKPVLARVSGSRLMILGEDFYKKPYIQGSVPYLTGNYRGGVLVYYDMEREKIVQTYEFKDEQVVYMSEEGYATIQDGKLRYYNVGKDEPIWTETIQDYEVGKGEEVIQYYFEEREGKLIVIREKDCTKKIMDEYVVN